MIENMIVFGYAGEISEAFKRGILPVLYDIGKVIFWCSTIYGIYYIMRRQVGEGADRMKLATIGYIALRLMDSFTQLIDAIADSIKF